MLKDDVNESLVNCAISLEREDERQFLVARGADCVSPRLNSLVEKSDSEMPVLTQTLKPASILTFTARLKAVPLLQSAPRNEFFSKL